MYKVLGVSIIHIFMCFGIYIFLIVINDKIITLVRDNEERVQFLTNKTK